MHEMSLMNDLFQKLKEVASNAHAEKVTKVHVEIGALAHISASHFREHFDELRQNSVAQDAELLISTNDDIHHERAQDITLLSIDVS